ADAVTVSVVELRAGDRAGRERLVAEEEVGDRTLADSQAHEIRPLKRRKRLWKRLFEAGRNDLAEDVAAESDVGKVKTAVRRCDRAGKWRQRARSRRGRRRHTARKARKVDRHAAQPRLARIAHSVAVEIVE